MNEDEEKNYRPSVQSRGRMMDFAPRNAGGAARPIRLSDADLTDNEQRRRELARREVARREEIHRQIERQKEEDIIAERRAIAARRDLARRLEIEREENKEALIAHEKELELRREREERAKRRAMIEARAMKERQRILAERRAKRARMELEARREAESKLRSPAVHEVRNPIGSKDPIARKIKLAEPEPEEFEEPKEEPKKFGSLFRRAPKKVEENKVEERLGSVADFEKDLDELENSSIIDENIEEFINDDKDDGFLDDIDEIEKGVKHADEDSSRSNDHYGLGGRSPFINTAVEKRPLSGGNKTFESTAAAASMTRHIPAKQPAKPAKAPKAPKARGRFVPYEEPIPHKNIYARTVAKEKESREVPTVVFEEAPKGSKVSLIVAIILTVILGAVVGAIAYLALFQ